MKNSKRKRPYQPELQYLQKMNSIKRQKQQTQLILFISSIALIIISLIFGWFQSLLDFLFTTISKLI